MNNQLMRAINQCEEDMYPMSVVLGYLASEFLRGPKDLKEMGQVVRISQETIKWSDTLDFVKKEIAKYPSWRLPVSQIGSYLPTSTERQAWEQVEQYAQPGDGFGMLFLRVCEQYFIPLFTSILREQGYDLASEDIEEATQAHHLTMRLFRKMVDQLTTEYQYRLSFSLGSLTAYFTRKEPWINADN